MVVTDMPYLEHLYLQVAGRGIWGYTGQLYIEVKIATWIPTYKPPVRCQYLPQLSVGNHPYVGIRNRDMQLAYKSALKFGPSF